MKVENLQVILALLAKEIGLDVASIGESGVRHAVQRRLAATKLESAQDYESLLANDPEELPALIDEVVVGETYFFREPHALEFMLREADSRRAGFLKEPLKILSIPVSTGEEPYSLVMLLLEAGWPRDRFVVDGIEISQRSLRLAREGLYSRHSFRNFREGFEKYFSPSHHKQQIDQEIREQVRLAPGNLVSATLSTPEPGYDFIFCRNLLIYFHEAAQAQALAHLERLLKPGGILFCGHSECGILLRHKFVPLEDLRAFAFQRQRTIVAQPKKETVRKPSAVQKPVALKMATPPPIAKAPLQVLPAPTPKTAAAPSLQEIEALANQGRFKEALPGCDLLLKTTPDSARAWYVKGIIQDALKEENGAIDCYKKAIYLDPNAVEAMIHLAAIYQKQGHPRLAAQFFQRAERIGKAA